MYEPEEPYVVQKTPGTKEYTVPFHLHHILEKAKVVYHDRKQIRGCL